MIQPWRSKKYLDWLKTFPCVCDCGRPASEAHHVKLISVLGGMGTKPSDAVAVPICRQCHNAIAERGERALFNTWSVDVELAIVRLLAEWLGGSK